MVSILIRTDDKNTTKYLKNKSFGAISDFCLTSLASVLCKIKAKGVYSIEAKGVYDIDSLKNPRHRIPLESKQSEVSLARCKVRTS